MGTVVLDRPTCYSGGKRVGYAAAPSRTEPPVNSSQHAPRHNARKAAARQLQRTYPGMKYTDAYAACSPDAAAWRTFSRSLHPVDLFHCTDNCLGATQLLVDAINDCADADRVTIATAATWTMQVATRLAEIRTHADTVEACAPFVPTNLPPMPPAPPLNPLASTNGLHEAAADLTHAHRITATLITSTAMPPEVRAIAAQIADLQRWISAPGN